MSKRTSSRKKGYPKKKKSVTSPLRRRTLTVLGALGLGAGLASFGLLGKNLLQPSLFKDTDALPLYLIDERMTSEGHPLILVEGWILLEQDLRHHKNK